MPAGMIDSSSKVKLPATAVTATGVSAVFSLEQCECYLLSLVAGTVTGTTPTLNAVLQTSPDNGTTWLNTGMYFATVNTTNQQQSLVFKPTLSVGQAASVVTGTLGTASALNQPIFRTYMRLSYTVTGTTPSIPLTLFVIENPKGYSSI